MFELVSNYSKQF